MAVASGKLSLPGRVNGRLLLTLVRCDHGVELYEAATDIEHGLC